MDTESFRVFGKDMIDYICNYQDTIADRDVAPTLDPGYLKKLIPSKFELFAMSDAIDGLITVYILRCCLCRNRNILQCNANNTLIIAFGTSW